MRKVMTRVLPLPAPARMSTGPSVVSTASRCCGFSWSRKDNAESDSGVDLSILHGCAQLTCRFKASEWWLTTLKPGWRSNAKRPIGHSPLKTFSRNFLRKPFAAQRSFHGVDKGGAPGPSYTGNSNMSCSSGGGRPREVSLAGEKEFL